MLRIFTTLSIATTLSLSALSASRSRPGPGPEQPPPKLQSIEGRTAGLRKLDGYVPLYWDEKTGSLFMEISRFDVEMLYATGLTAGLGSNDIGLDRGQAGAGRIVRCQRVGPRILLVQPNYTFRATTTNADEQRAVQDAFAKSILWGFSVAAESSGRVLVDATDFFLRDAHNVISRLRPGSFHLDRTRSALNMLGTKAFPKNSSPRTKSVTRSASAISTTTAPRAAFR